MMDEYKRQLYESIGQLKEKYPEDTRISVLYEGADILSQTDDKEIQTRCLEVFQDTNDKLFETYGVSDEVIGFQVLINQLRSKLDVPDEKELIYQHDDGSFAQ